MGYLVLLDRNNDLFDVINGQQGLTTISIIVLSVLHYLSNVLKDEPFVADRIAELKSSYIVKRSSTKLIVEHKLTLNKNNNLVFTRLINNENLPLKGLKPTEILMRECFEYFNKQISTLNRNGEGLAAFVENIVNKIYFTRVIVTDELNAYKVFETLNSTGVKLSSTDLLKNYLFQIVDDAADDNKEEHIKIIDNKWSYISGRLENDDFPDYLRAYWNGRKRSLSKRIYTRQLKKKLMIQSQHLI